MRNARTFLLIGSVAAIGVFASAFIGGCGDDTKPPSAFQDTGNDGGGGGDGGMSCTGLSCTGGDGGGKPGCVGLQCQQADCGEGGTPTTLTGKVYDPAGKVPLYNVIVYIPNAPPDPIMNGASCDRCNGTVTGNPVAITLTDANGAFTLTNVPSGVDIPLVMQIGKWRRQVKLPAASVTKCASTPIADASLTRLPRNKSEGDIPQMALTTGGADPLECLLRKIGLDDSEFGVAGSDARVHLYQGGGYPGTDGGTITASASLADGGTPFPSATPLWADETALSKYDVLLMSCEGTENPATKPAASETALYNYAKAGGRVFASHFHEYWFRTNPDPAVVAVGNPWYDPEHTPPNLSKTVPVNANISTKFPKAVALHDWLKGQNALNGDQLPIVDSRANLGGVGPNALDWIDLLNPNDNNMPAIEYFTFNTPVGAADADVCGRVVFNDLHVGSGGGDVAGAAFPDGCTTMDLTPQQKALEFMLFDLSSCVQNDSQPPVVK